MRGIFLAIITSPMARPAKDPRHRMSTHLRIPVTDEQKRKIMEAIADEPTGFAAWARAVLLQAANDRLGSVSARKRSREGE